MRHRGLGIALARRGPRRPPGSPVCAVAAGALRPAVPSDPDGIPECLVSDIMSSGPAKWHVPETPTSLVVSVITSIQGSAARGRPPQDSADGQPLPIAIAQLRRSAAARGALASGYKWLRW